MLGCVLTVSILSGVLCALSDEIALIGVNGRVAQQIDHVVGNDQHQTAILVQPVVCREGRSSRPGEALEFVSGGIGLSGRKPDGLIPFEGEHSFEYVARQASGLLLGQTLYRIEQAPIPRGFAVKRCVSGASTDVHRELTL